MGRIQIAGDVRGGPADNTARITTGVSGIASVTIGGSLIGETKGSGVIFSFGLLGPVVIGGHIQGGVGEDSGQVDSNNYVTSVTVGGSVLGGTGTESGRIRSAGGIGPVVIAGDIRGGGGNSSGTIRTHGDLGALSVLGSLIGSGHGSASVNSDGGMGQVQIAGDVIAGAGAADSARIGSGSAGLAGIQIGGSLAGTGAGSGIITSLGDIGRVFIGGDLIGSIGLNSGYLNSEKYITSVSIGGSVVGGTGGESARIRSAGGIGPITIGGDLRGGDGNSSGTIRTHGALASLSVQGSLLGVGHGSASVNSDGGMGTVRIGGDVIAGSAAADSARIGCGAAGLAGITIGGSFVGTGNGSGLITTPGNIGPVWIGGDFQGGSGTNSGQINGGGTIARVTIGRSMFGGAGLESGEIKGKGIGDLTIGGSLSGGSGNRSGAVISAGDIADVVILGNLQGGDVTGTSSLDSSGYLEAKRIASLWIGGSLVAGTNSGTGTLTKSGSIRVHNDLGTTTIIGSVIGNATNPAVISARGAVLPTGDTDIAIHGLTVNGSVSFALILAGYEVNGTGVNSDAQTGIITVGADWEASNLAAGVSAGADSFFGTADDTKLSGAGVKDDAAVISTIAGVSIGGQVSGDGVPTNHFGFVTEWILAFKIGGNEISLSEGPHNDSVVLTPAGDVLIREV